MKILIVSNSHLPVFLYGGTERVVWYLGKELSKLGHDVTYLAKKGSYSDFAKVIPIDETTDLIAQIPADFDVVHFNLEHDNLENLKIPYIITIHGNNNGPHQYNKNTVFVSQNHAERHGSNSFVHNGLDWDDYKKPNLNAKKNEYHFLGNAAWRLKNVKGAISVIKDIKSHKLNVLGGVRFNIKMGIRFTFSPKVRFYGMVGGEQKNQLLESSKGLIFPVRWHEPFGLAITESLYFGCPIFATPYGAISEIVKPEVGYLSNKKSELVEAIKNSNYSNKLCHEYALEEFNSKKMALSYLKKYELVINGEELNPTQPQLKVIQTEKFLPWEE